MNTQVFAEEAAKRITVREIVLVDDRGRERLNIRPEAIAFKDEQGQVTNIIGTDSMHIKKPGEAMGVSLLSDGISMGGTVLVPAMRMSTDGEPSIKMAGTTGKEEIEIGIHQDTKKGAFVIRDRRGSPRLLVLTDMIMLVNSDGKARWSAPPTPPIP